MFLMLHANRFDVFSSTRSYRSRARWQSDHDVGEEEDNLLDQVVKSCANKRYIELKREDGVHSAVDENINQRKALVETPAISG